MIPKLTTSDAFDFGQLPNSIVPVSSKGTDVDYLKKVAGEEGIFHKELADLKPDKDKTYVHLIALGDEETVGANRNGDAFSREDNIKKHGTFVDLGHVFKNHKSDDPEKSVGDVLASAHNGSMGRVELLIALKNKLAEKEVQELNGGKQLAFSMGSLQDFDVCSLCGHKAPTAKDHCFGPETLILMADLSLKHISEILVGDEVIDANGQPVEVIKLFKNEAAGDVYRLKTSLTGLETIVTGNHPIMSCPAELGTCRYGTRDAATFATCWRGSRPECSTCRLPPIRFTYTDVSDVRVGDYVYCPIASLTTVEPSISLEKAWLIGLFAAEGSYSKNKKGQRNSVQFSINKNETDFVERIKMVVEREYGLRVCVYPAGANGLSVRVHSGQLADEMFRYAGEYAHSKKFSAEVMAWPLPYLEAVATGLFDGDGHLYARPGRRQTTKLNSASRHFVSQIQQLCLRLGKQAIYGVQLVPGGPTKRTNVFTQYYVQSCLFADDAAPASALRRHLIDGRLTGCITKKEKIDYRGYVYNFETTSGSYVADGLAVHNCDHIKNNLREVTSDGRMIYMKNPNPKFFDISIVHKPADRVAYMLKKVALEQGVVGGHELADAFGFSHWSHPKYATMKTLASLIKRIPALGKKIAASRSLDPATIKRLKLAAAGYGVQQVVHYLNKNAVLLNEKDFSDVVVGKPCCFDGAENLDDVMDDHTQIEAFEQPEIKENLPELLGKEDLDAAGMNPEHATARSLQITIVKPAKTATVIDQHELAALKTLYSHYKVAFATFHQDNPRVLAAVAATF